jgi:hypothetical protein
MDTGMSCLLFVASHISLTSSTLMYVCIWFTGNAPFSNGLFRIFFDTDINKNTGYGVGVPGGIIGSELLLEGSSFYDQRSGGWNDGVVSVSLFKMVSDDGLSVEMSIDRHATYSDGSRVFSLDTTAMIVNIADTSWNLVEFSPKTLNGYVYSFCNSSDVVVRHDHDLGSDLRAWRPEKGVITLTGSMNLPRKFQQSSENQENVTLGLWFPDPASSLRNHTRLSVQLGTTVSGGYWDSIMGVNVLPYEINVTEVANETMLSCFTIKTIFSV